MNILPKLIKSPEKFTWGIYHNSMRTKHLLNILVCTFIVSILPIFSSLFVAWAKSGPGQMQVSPLHQKMIKQLNDLVNKDQRKAKNLAFQNGAVATVYGTEFNQADHLLFKKFKKGSSGFYFENKEFSFDYKFYIRSTAYPTVVVLAGLEGEINGRYTKTFQSFFGSHSKVNMLVLDTLTSAPTIRKHLYPSLGGLHETIYLKMAITQYLKQKEFLAQPQDVKNHRVILVGASASTVGLYYGSHFLNKFPSGPKVIGMMFIASHNNINPVMDLTCFAYYKRSSKCNDGWKDYSILTRKFARPIFDKLIKMYTMETDPYVGMQTIIIEDSSTGHDKITVIPSKEKFGSHFIAPTKTPNLYDFYQDAFNETEEKFQLQQNLIRLIMPEGITKPERYVFKNIHEYYNSIQLTDHTELLKVPLLWLHAKDDPLANYRKQFIPVKKAFKEKNNPYFIGLGTKNGGHGGYARIYGRKWMQNITHSFINIVSQQK